MDVVGFISSQTLFDVLWLVIILAGVILGFGQGAIRRLLGIGAMLLAFLLAANLRAPLGGFFARNWTQFPAGYSEMIAFLVAFLVAFVVLSVFIQSFYHRSLIHPSEALDEIVGAVLGAVEAILLVGCLVVILDSYFHANAAQVIPGELPVLRPFFDAYDTSSAGALYRDILIPAFFAVTGFFIPEAIRQTQAR